MEQTKELNRYVGYELKRVQATLRIRMEDALREHGLTVPQYACMELLDQRPGLSNAELARAAFVTRQSMNLVLRGLQDAGLVHRPDEAPHGRARPSELTDEGRARLGAAREAVSDVEAKMVRSLPPERVDMLLDTLAALAHDLEE